MFFETDNEESKTNDVYIWAEKYRPNNLDEYLGNEQIKNSVSTYIETGEIPHLLFYSKKPGTGKTTVAKMIAKSIPSDVMYINASDERKLDDIRDKVKSFASSLGFQKLKILILDECLDENTLVTVLRDGEYKKIQICELNDSSDLVKSYNFDKNLVEWTPFSLMDKGDRETYEIEFENGEKIVCTDNHKWYVEIDGDVVRKPLSFIIENEISEIISPNMIE
jgi:hypothetical protein